MQTVFIQTNNGPVAIEGDVIGAFVVQDRPYDTCEVFHLFTGLVMPYRTTSSYLAETFCREAMQLPIDWYFGGMSADEGIEAARPVFREWYLRSRYA